MEHGEDPSTQILASMRAFWPCGPQRRICLSYLSSVAMLRALRTGAPHRTCSCSVANCKLAAKNGRRKSPNYHQRSLKHNQQITTLGRLLGNVEKRIWNRSSIGAEQLAGISLDTLKRREKVNYPDTNVKILEARYTDRFGTMPQH